MDFLYDESGNAYSFVYNGTQYYYVRNLQGDVVKILNTSGGVVASYTYDAWGKVTNSGNVVGQYNPIRYRGYYYDTDTGFYYLQSRYYDPAIKRFISADDASLLGANGDFASLNLYAYCGNNPLNCIDPTGQSWTDVGMFFKKLGSAILNSIEFEFGIGYGIGFSKEISGVKVEAEMYSDIYTIRLDDSEMFMENSGNAGLSAKIISDKLSVGPSYSYHHDYVDRPTDCKKHNALSNPFSVAVCPYAEKSSAFTVNSLDPASDLVLGHASSDHLVVGYHFSIGINITQVIREMRGIR